MKLNTEAMKTVRNLIAKRNEAERAAGYSQITSDDDPRVIQSRRYNAALSQLTDEESQALEAEWYASK